MTIIIIIHSIEHAHNCKGGQEACLGGLFFIHKDEICQNTSGGEGEGRNTVQEMKMNIILQLPSDVRTGRIGPWIFIILLDEE